MQTSGGYPSNPGNRVKQGNSTSFLIRNFRPASSAGVERMFSKAGKLYDDAEKKQDEELLEAMLFAAANTE